MDTFHRNLFAITAASFIGFTGFTLVMPFLPLYFEQLGVHDQVIGMLVVPIVADVITDVVQQCRVAEHRAFGGRCAEAGP